MKNSVPRFLNQRVRRDAVAPTGSRKAGAMRRGIAEQVIWRDTPAMTPFPRNPRVHSDAQIAFLMKSIRHGTFFNPILIDEAGVILAGHARHLAAQRLGMARVPTVTIFGLSDAEKRAIVIADNRAAEQSAWDFDLLRDHFKGLIELDFDIELTGFTTGEVDLLIDGEVGAASADPADDVKKFALDGPAVSKPGDLWACGPHLVLCGDAVQRSSYQAVLDGHFAQMLITDPPFNVPIAGHAMGRGKIRHRNFMQASGEMSAAEFTKFLEKAVSCFIEFSADGSIHDIFMDWRHLPELLSAGLSQYSEWKNLLVWNKTNAGQGSFYRSKHELIAVFKKGTGAHVNNFGLGKLRYRTNVLDYPGVNSLHPARKGDLALHPTVKPLALIADLIRDCSKRHGIILDPFGGSGTTMLAAERTGRVARLIELDPLYVDVAVRRWEVFSGTAARHAGSGRSFGQVAEERSITGGSQVKGGTGACHE